MPRPRPARNGTHRLNCPSKSSYPSSSCGPCCSTSLSLCGTAAGTDKDVPCGREEAQGEDEVGDAIVLGERATARLAKPQPVELLEEALAGRPGTEGPTWLLPTRWLLSRPGAPEHWGVLCVTQSASVDGVADSTHAALHDTLSSVCGDQDHPRRIPVFYHQLAKSLFLKWKADPSLDGTQPANNA